MFPRDEPPSGLAGGKVVNVDRVEWDYIPDAGTATSALLSGEIGFYLQPPYELLPVLAANPDITIETLDTSGSQGIMRMNFLQPPFNNVKAREALLWMIDQEEYLKVGIGNPDFYETCYAIFMCGSPLESDVGTEALQAHDLDKAAQLLKESGYNGEPIVVLDQSDHSVYHKIALLTAENLRKIGANVEVASMTNAMVMERRVVQGPTSEGGWNIFHTDFQGIDLANPLTNRPLGSDCGKTGWPGWPCDEKISALLAKFAAEADPAVRKDIAVEIQAEAMQYVTHAWFGQFYKPAAYRGLEGVLKGPAPVFWNLKLK